MIDKDHESIAAHSASLDHGTRCSRPNRRSIRSADVDPVVLADYAGNWMKSRPESGGEWTISRPNKKIQE